MEGGRRLLICKTHTDALFTLAPPSTTTTTSSSHLTIYHSNKTQLSDLLFLQLAVCPGSAVAWPHFKLRLQPKKGHKLFIRCGQTEF